MQDKPLLRGCALPEALVLERVVATRKVDGLVQEKCWREELAKRRMVNVEVCSVKGKITNETCVDMSNANTCCSSMRLAESSSTEAQSMSTISSEAHPWM